MQNTIHVNTYLQLAKPNVLTTMPVFDWFEQIKSSEYSESITLARKHEKGSPLYDGIKGSIPCVTFNFLFDAYKESENILSGTGLLYIDIDDVSFNIEQLDTSKVFTYYKSFGGKGYGILIRVDGLTLENYKVTYLSILDELGLSEYYDKGAVKATQYNVLSYDPDIFVNPDSFIFSPSIIDDPKPYVIEREKKPYTQRLGSDQKTIRFDDIDTIPINGDYEVFHEGVDIVKCFIPMKKIASNRNDTLIAYCNNLVYLNPQLSVSTVVGIMQNVNSYMCANPFDSAKIEGIVKSVFKYKEDGSLKPILFKKKRRVIFNKNFQAKPIEKLIIAGKEVNKMKVENSKQKLYEIIEGWDFDSFGEITQVKVINSRILSRNTVQKYWKEFKNYVCTINNEYKAHLSASKVISHETMVKHQPIDKPSLEKTYSDEVVCVKDLMIGLYLESGEQVDVDGISEFMMALNKSNARISEIVEMVVKVVRENNYFNSPYSHIQIPRSVIALIREHKFGVTEFIYKEVA